MNNFFNSISNFFQSIAMIVYLSFITIIKTGFYPLIYLVSLVDSILKKKAIHTPTRQAFWFGIAGTLLGWIFWLLFVFPSMAIIIKMNGFSGFKIIAIGIMFALSAYIDIKRLLLIRKEKKTNGLVKE